jgi:hypothetical protein
MHSRGHRGNCDRRRPHSMIGAPPKIVNVGRPSRKKEASLFQGKTASWRSKTAVTNRGVRPRSNGAGVSGCAFLIAMAFGETSIAPLRAE